MSESENIVHVGGALNIDQLNQRIEDLQELLRKVFREGVDFGFLPGMKEKKENEDAAFTAGKRKDKSAIKPMLLKPGVEKINTRYGLFPFYLEQPTRELPGDHREIKLICELRAPKTGIVVAQGVGSCSTYESKYRYRWTSTDRRVPKEYWDTRDPDILGGKQYSPRKNYDEETGKTEWFIFEKIGVADPADVWNTIYKMAAKRAKSDATFSATAAGDIFDTEDLEDPDLIPVNERKCEKKPNPKADVKLAPVKDIEGKIRAVEAAANRASIRVGADNPASQPPDQKPTPDGGLDVFDTLEKELAEFCEGDTDMMQDKLQALTSFPEMKKDKIGKYTKEPTGKMVPGIAFVSELRMKGSDVRARIALDKLLDEKNGER